MTWTINYSGLNGPATAAHFHSPAEAGKNVPPTVPLSGKLDSPIKGEATLTDAQAKDLKDGKMYFNVHTAANKGGEDPRTDGEEVDFVMLIAKAREHPFAGLFYFFRLICAV